MVQKLPPPPQFAGNEWQQFNRWLVELTGVLANNGGIDPAAVDGLPALAAQVETNTTDIVSLQGVTGGQSGAIAALQSDVATNTAAIAALAGTVTTLAARAQAFNGTTDPAAGLGVVGDWYGRTDAGNRAVWVKTGAATWTRISTPI